MIEDIIKTIAKSKLKDKLAEIDGEEAVRKRMAKKKRQNAFGSRVVLGMLLFYAFIAWALVTMMSE